MNDIRLDFKEVESDIFKILSFSEKAEELEEQWSDLKNKEDWSNIYTLEGEDRFNLEEIYSVGKDFALFIKDLGNINNDIERFPKISNFIQYIEKSGYQEKYLNDLLKKAKVSYEVLNFNNWAMEQMFILFERQIKILINIKDIIKDIKSSDLYKKENKINKGEEVMEKLDIFISHSEKDSDLASSLIELLREALNIEKKKIRCTSVAGYELKYGRSIVELIKEDLVSSKIVIALLTKNALNSTWVMFELGGAWFADSFIVPILNSELSIKDLPGPLNTSAILGSSDKDDIENRINGLLDQLAKDFDFKRDSDGAVSKKIKMFIKELKIEKSESKKKA